MDEGNKLNVEAIMTLNLGTGYLVSTNSPSAIVEVDQNFGSNAPIQVISLPSNTGNIGMAWHPVNSNLVLSVNYNNSGLPLNFATLGTNGVLSNWSGISNIRGEVDLAIVPTNAAGFNKGDMYFADGFVGGIGMLSGDGTTSNTFWTSVFNVNPQETLTEAGFYFDQTGIFSNNLVVGTQSGGIYTIDSSTNITPWAFLTNFLFENVLTLPNDTNRYGPWAGKILAGNEPNNVTIPFFVTVDTNRVITLQNFNVAAEDSHIIPANQDYYFNDILNNQILKLPRHWLTNYAGDVLFSEEGLGGVPQALFIFHWDAPSGSFIKHILPCKSAAFPGGFSLEQGAFAPIDIPATSISN